MDDRHLIVFAPYLPPSPLAVAQRFHHFIEILEESQYHLNIITGKQAHWGSSLFFDLPSTPTGFYWRSLREILSGLELGVRVALAKEPCLFLSSPPFFTALLGAFSAHLRKKYYILDVRDNFPDSILKQGRLRPNGFIGRLLAKASRWLFKHSVVVFTATQSVREDVIAKNPELAERCFCVWNGYDTDLFQPSEVKFPKFTCVMHGNTGFLNDIPLLRSVAAELKNMNAPVDIVVCGPGPQTALIKGANLDNFRHEGVLDPQKTAELVKQSHLGLSFRAPGLSGELAFSQTVFDCLGAGIPVVCTPTSEGSRFIEDNLCGVSFSTKDPKAIAQKIHEISQSPDMYQSYVGNVMKVRESVTRQGLRQIVVEVMNQL